MSDYTPIPGEFAIDLVWPAVQALLVAAFAGVIDVDCIGEKDFDEEGYLTIDPPAARVLFMEETPKPVEPQMLNYQTEVQFAVICAGTDFGADPQQQRLQSVAVASQVKHALIGARLVLDTDEVSEPIEYLGMKPMPTASVGMAYVPVFKVGGVAQFAGPNAWPTLPAGVTY